MQCPRCHHENRDASNFCVRCGTDLHPAAAVPAGLTPCPKCGEPCKPGSRICPACGKALAAEDSSTAAKSTAQTGSTTQRKQPALRKKPLLISLLAAATLILLTTVGLWLSRSTPDPQRPATAAEPPAADGAPRREDSPPPPAPHDAQRSTAALYLDACARCHDRGEAGSPRVGYPEDWKSLRIRSHAEMVRIVLDGHGGSPAGAGVALTEEEASLLVVEIGQRIEESAGKTAHDNSAGTQTPTANEQAASTPRPAQPGESAWLTDLRRELGQCEQLSFFARIPCREKARWRHCKQHWNDVPECTSNEPNP